MRKEEPRTKNNGREKTSPSGLESDPQDRSVARTPFKVSTAAKAIGDNLRNGKRAAGSNYHDDSGDSENLSSQVRKLLDQNPLLTGKPICKLLDLDYKQHGKSVNNIKTLWKYHHKNEQGSNCSNPDVHAWRGFCHVPVGLVDRKAALEHGWSESRSRNRFLLWKDARLGRMQWFETNRVNLYVRKPANLGKASQLFCLGFYANGLISDIKILEPILRTLHFKSAHFAFKTNERLPRINIPLFQESNGIFIKLGDRSHPHSVEVIASYMDWAERWERLAEKQLEALEGLGSSKTLKPRQDKSFGVI